MADLLVPPDGPLTARICLVGQNPGKTEINEYVRKPFQGYSGNLLKKWWAALTPPLRREEIYVDNLIPYMCEPEKLNEEELRYWEEELHKRLSLLSQCNVIVPVGNHACYALIGKGRVAGASKKDAVGITSLRGSIYAYDQRTTGRTIKVIPTLHPSALFQRDNSKKMGVTKGLLEKRVFRDWQRIAFESTFSEIRQPQRTYVITPYEADAARYTQEVEEQGDQIHLAVDIETSNNKIDCVGFSHDSSLAMVIPTQTKTERETFMPYIQRLLDSPSLKVFQNGHYDTYWLHHYDCPVRNWFWDLMYMHVICHPADNHSLDFLSSMYLPYHQYWKDHAKSENGEGRYEWTKDRDKLLTYNGMDVCISRELLDWIWADVESMGLGEYYLSNIQPLYQPLLEISLNGVLVDQDKQLMLREVTKLESEETRLKLKALAGEDLVSKTGLSPLKLKKFFHDTLKLPKQYKITKKVDGKSKSVSLDAINLAKLAYRYKAAKEPAQLVVDYRAQMKKLESWLEPGKQDEDGYVRAQFSPTTEAGRLASRAHPMGRAVKPVKVKGAPRRKKGDPVPAKPVDRGYNLQNTKKEIREIYKPDPGCLLLEIDQSQVEDRMCKMYTRAPRLVELANRHPSVHDVH
ncbi:MAG: uracil-DNA glycosylase family protein, partial [Candidatus Bipolaricaulis sp.]|nr:uracil-DNA glycosylase family protein [Candidatus Bipolaricaulis sp.]